MSEPASQSKTGLKPGYQIFMLALCLYAVGALAARTAIRFNDATITILDTADYVVCAVFFLDFLWNLKRAENAWRYFITWGWIDLLSSLPMVNAARWGGLARVMRIIRVLRVLRAGRRLAAAIMRGRAENTALAVSLVALLLVTFCSIAVLNFEDVPGANILTPGGCVVVGGHDYYHCGLRRSLSGHDRRPRRGRGADERRRRVVRHFVGVPRQVVHHPGSR